MSPNDLHIRIPGLEEYSRATNPERFRPLHALALELVERLSKDYDVSRTDSFALLPGVRPFEHALPPITLTPSTPEAAPLAVAFTNFPSLIVGYGRWHAEPFPVCACDACGATAARESERLEALFRDVVTGHFREEIRIPLLGEATLRASLGDPAGNMGHGERVHKLPRKQARALHGDGTTRVQWQPWLPRKRQSA